jgi:hypothetical protein
VISSIIDGLRARGLRPTVPFSACPAFTRDLGARHRQLLAGAATSGASASGPAARARGMRWLWIVAALLGLAALVGLGLERRPS